MSLPFIIGLAAIAVIVYLVSEYNFFVSARTRIQASIQEIGNQLKRQAELIPNLESAAKGYLAHEKGIMQLIADARKLVASGKDASAKIAEFLPKLQVVVESNPELKGAEVVTRLMDELRDTSDKVMYARRTLIDLTADYNVKRVTFPTSIVANLFGFQAEKGLDTPTSGAHLQVSEEDVKSPKVSL
ncbi:MAG: LemA family protein [bacterium]|nr:LemA family protein [bacterium]